MTQPGAAHTGLLTPAEVRLALHVSDKTLWRWAREGKLASIRTLGGHRRYSLAQVEALLKAAAP